MARDVPQGRRAGSHNIEVLSAFCEFSRLCRAEKFACRRNADPLDRAAGFRPWPESVRSPHRLVPDSLSRLMRASARRVRRRDLNGLVMGHARLRDPRRETGRSEDHNTHSFYQKEISTKIDTQIPNWNCRSTTGRIQIGK